MEGAHFLRWKLLASTEAIASINIKVFRNELTQLRHIFADGTCHKPLSQTQLIFRNF